MSASSNVTIASPNTHAAPVDDIHAKELRELTKLKKEGHDTAFLIRKDELDLGMTESSEAELKGPLGRPKTRINKLLQDAASTDANTQGRLVVSSFSICTHFIFCAMMCLT